MVEGKQQFNVYLPKALVRAIRLAAAEDATPASAVIEQALVSFLAARYEQSRSRKEGHMPTTETILRVLVASPSDVAFERRALNDVIGELNSGVADALGVRLVAVRWESDVVPSMGPDPQAVVSGQVGDAYDIFVGVLWTKIGTRTPRALSGTIEEFERAYDRFRNDPRSVQIMFYFNETPIAPNDIDPEQLGAVRAFRQKIGELGIYGTYQSPEEFVSKIRTHLLKVVYGWGKSWVGGVQDHLPGFLAAGDVKGDSDGVHGGELVNMVIDTEDDQQEDGFLDLVISAQEQLDVGTEVVGRMNDSIASIGGKMSKRSDEMREAHAAPKMSQLGLYKRAGDGAAVDMMGFVRSMEADIPLFSEAYAKAMESYGRAAVMLKDFEGTGEEEISAAIDAIKNLRNGISSSGQSLDGMSQAVSGLPRLTQEFAVAKTRTLNVMRKLHDEWGKAERTAEATEQALSQVKIALASR